MQSVLRTGVGQSFLTVANLPHVAASGFFVRNGTVVLFRWFTSEKSVNIDVKKLKQMMESNNLKLIDVREPYELEEAGKIPNSVNIPLGEIEDAFKLDGINFREKYKIEKPGVADKNLVFSCRSGVRSLRALKIVKDLGYENPLNLVGGYNAWAKENTGG
uniref:SJCHGC01785 protein n=1 Tax=Schistosoma japonicum TaxID=6182 RepID=Q5DC45_SCHJA|nr:SJCHGC01785 protein [Schistosoma japonicum]